MASLGSGAPPPVPTPPHGTAPAIHLWQATPTTAKHKNQLNLYSLWSGKHPWIGGQSNPFLQGPNDTQSGQTTPVPLHFSVTEKKTLFFKLITVGLFGCVSFQVRMCEKSYTKENIKIAILFILKNCIDISFYFPQELEWLLFLSADIPIASDFTLKENIQSS